MWDYLNFYLSADVLFLADACENFRKMVMKLFSIDPFHYLTLAAFGFNTMLEVTKKKRIECFDDTNMILFSKKGLRGGYTFGSRQITD